ncbi:extracellular solute-binding protein [Desulfomicrobium sp. ZS1]|uniref:extracellular solute-binding protein n=1 Tax=Desulfomicrobium sp. ZS1 TaxID=2952228 RepID=UPI0020B1F9D3|nr:extracellular solute-binding protein [Desulfomicrobium sp. ZS1]UTF51627.1 extracellular solute-binding protein [Desulfomicrobium sp. ZS1]
MKHLFLFVLLLGFALPASAGDFSHALAMNGQPRYSADFTHFDYVSPDAPKGGTVRLAATGTFDSFNPYIVKGNSADGLGLLFDTLTEQSLDEPFTEYGLLAERIELAPDRSFMTFHLRKEARFHDGSPVTAQDVAFTFKTLLAQGNPHYAQYYADVERVDVVDAQTVTFVFKPQSSQELPLILGQLPVLSEASWQGRDFSASSLDIPLGSGPYRIAEFKAGQRLTFVRDPGYWGRDLPVNTGRHNFDSIIYDYYRDLTVTLEAFKAGEYDFRQEYNSKQWATGYTGPAVEAGLIRTENIPHKLAQGMQAFVFNSRRAIFADPLVRQALNFAFDFEWSNKNLFYGQYARSTSFFSNSDMAATGLPSKGERELLEPLGLPEDVYTKEISLPVSDGSGNIRENLREAARLLRQAGWSVEGGKLVKDGQPFVFEMLLVQPDFERVVLPFQRNLARLGITMSVRMVDTSQYLERLRGFDFDMIVSSFPQSLSPGNEQRSFWYSASADMPGSRNYCGIKSPAIDKLVDLVIAAPDRDALILRCKALDRALLWGWYVIPHWHATSWRVAYWDKFGRPDKLADYGLDFQSWWIDPDKERELAGKRKGVGLK